MKIYKTSKYFKIMTPGVAVVAAVFAGLIFMSCAISQSNDDIDKNDNTDDNAPLSLEDMALPLESVTDLDILIENASKARYVLLGESSHGTSEYYKWRAEISKRLIAEKGFTFIAIEGDWPYIHQTNRYVKGLDGAPSDGKSALLEAVRWPGWMWANEEFLELVEWLREYNDALPMEKRVGLYGMDMQNMPGSIEASIENLKQVDRDLSNRIARNYACLLRYDGDMIAYARGFSSTGESCEQDVKQAMDELRKAYTREELFNSHDLFDIKQNMLAVKFAERNARAMVGASGQSWNVRVQYMKETVGRLSERYTDESRGIVWAHNTHVGDARATQMTDGGMVNIGQLLRQKHGKDDIFIVGFGTHRGSVLAGRRWGEEEKKMTIPEAITGSLEYHLKKLNMPAFMIFLDKDNLPDVLTDRLGHRAKGVVYNPEREHGNYVQTVLAERYNAFIFLEETTALNPL